MSQLPAGAGVCQLQETDTNNVRKLVEACNKNLTVIRDFLLTSKEQVNKRTTCLTVVDLVGQYLLKILSAEAAPSLSEEKICQVVENVVSKKLDEKLKSHNVPTYSQAATAIPKVGNTNINSSAQPVPKFKVIVRPNSDCQGIQSSEDTKKLLTSKSQKIYGITVDKMVTLKDNAVLLESRSETLLSLESSKTLAELQLSARPISKSWPKIQVFDIPIGTTKEAVIEDLKAQDYPVNLPKDFIRSAFKINSRDSQAEKQYASWVFEIHPIARNHLTKIGRIYSSWRAHKVRDFTRVTRCYKCQRFGHISKFCTSQRICGYCTSTDHDTKDCAVSKKTEKHKCANCLRSGITNTDHHTACNTCPIYIARLNDLINDTEYMVDG